MFVYVRVCARVCVCVCVCVYMFSAIGSHVHLTAGVRACVCVCVCVIGLIAGLLRTLFAGESLFVQTLQATHGEGDALLCPQDVGDVELITLTPGDSLLLQKGAFLASDMSGLNV